MNSTLKLCKWTRIFRLRSSYLAHNDTAGVTKRIYKYETAQGFAAYTFSNRYNNDDDYVDIIVESHRSRGYLSHKM